MDSANVMAATSWQQSLGGKVLAAKFWRQSFGSAVFAEQV
jgi:hypothetical protein